jgi:uncharacterized membrane protein YkoI
MLSNGLFGSIVAFFLACAPARADEEKVALDKVPRPILDAVKARFEGAEVTGAGKETEDGKPVFEITIKHKGQNIDVTLSPEGEILVIEKEIAASDLPRAVSRAMEEKYPKATYKIVEQIVKVEKKKEKLADYEVQLVTEDRKGLEVEVTPEGKILNEEKKGAEKDD